MKMYIAGPMRGIAEFNFPAFDEARDTWASRGYTPISPADHDRENGFDAAGMTGHEDLAALDFDLKETLMWDLRQVADADLICLLPGWRNSSGARAEMALAAALGKTAFEHPDMARAMPAADLLAVTNV